MSTPDVRLKWGHALLTPEGAEIRVPNIFKELKQLGLVERDRPTGLFRLRPTIDAFLNADVDTLMGSLRRILGRELEGPEWVRCKCPECRQREQDADQTKLPWRMLNRADVIAAMQKDQHRRFYRREARN